jgi:alkylhydroperoxidase/carboxymuconolactone decarboxylase family protein YurZ
MSALTPHTITLLRVSVVVVLGDWTHLRELRRAAPAGEPNRAWREAVLQTHLFAGFPRLVEAFGVLQEEGGLGQADPDECAPERTEPEDIEAGFEFFQTVYGHRAPRVRDMLEGYHPDWARWVLGHAYGRVLARPGLDAALRELCAVVSLAALAQGRQLAGHARGAIRCGASPQDLTAALDAVADLLDAEDLHKARAVVAAFGKD